MFSDFPPLETCIFNLLKKYVEELVILMIPSLWIIPSSSVSLCYILLLCFFSGSSLCYLYVMLLLLCMIFYFSLIPLFSALCKAFGYILYFSLDFLTFLSLSLMYTPSKDLIIGKIMTEHIYLCRNSSLILFLIKLFVLNT